MSHRRSLNFCHVFVPSRLIELINSITKCLFELAVAFLLSKTFVRVVFQ